MGGHSNLSVNPAEMGRVNITHKMCPQLYHVTYRRNIDSIYDIGLRPGGLDRNGRREVFFSCELQAGWNHETNEIYYAACNNSHSIPTSLPARVGYPYKKGDSALCIDTKLAEACGVEFWQNQSFAILADKPIPPSCLIHVENLKTGGITRQKLKMVTIGATSDSPRSEREQKSKALIA